MLWHWAQIVVPQLVSVISRIRWRFRLPVERIRVRVVRAVAGIAVHLVRGRVGEAVRRGGGVSRRDAPGRRRSRRSARCWWRGRTARSRRRRCRPAESTVWACRVVHEARGGPHPGRDGRRGRCRRPSVAGAVGGVPVEVVDLAGALADGVVLVGREQQVGLPAVGEALGGRNAVVQDVVAGLADRGVCRRPTGRRSREPRCSPGTAVVQSGVKSMLGLVLSGRPRSSGAWCRAAVAASRITPCVPGSVAAV